MKRTFYTEMAYIIGIVSLSFGTAFIYGNVLDVIMRAVAVLLRSSCHFSLWDFFISKA